MNVAKLNCFPRFLRDSRYFNTLVSLILSKDWRLKTIDYFPKIIILLILAAILSCSRDRNKPGYSYFPDMAESQAYEYYSVNKNFADGKTAQPPVEETIPRDFIPYQYEKGADGQKLAGKELKNPIMLNNLNLEKGKEQYDIFCTMCHGDLGNGDGFLITSEKFLAKVANLNDRAQKNRPEGEIYHIITLGSVSTLMGAHGPMISPEDRWKIISYIKNDFSTEPK